MGHTVLLHLRHFFQFNRGTFTLSKKINVTQTNVPTEFNSLKTLWGLNSVSIAAKRFIWGHDLGDYPIPFLDDNFPVRTSKAIVVTGHHNHLLRSAYITRFTSPVNTPRLG